MDPHGEEREYYSATQFEKQEETSQLRIRGQGVLFDREKAPWERFPSFHDCETGNGIEMDTESDKTVLDISFAEQETRATGNSGRDETTDT